MATWANVCEWRPEPLEESAESLRTMHGTLTHLREDAQLTLTRVASRGEAVDAARAALRTCIASHGEHIDVVTRLMTATREAGDGVAAVRRKALACLNYADAHPQVVLGPDGAVTVAPTASGTGAGGTPPTADGSTADAGQTQAQAAEHGLVHPRSGRPGRRRLHPVPDHGVIERATGVIRTRLLLVR